jgi:ribosome biogenesis GTPase
MKGKITKSTGSWYDILDEQGQTIKGRLRGKFKHLELKVTNPIAVGDQVEFEMEEDGRAVITVIVPRSNYIIRKSPHKTAHAHLLASNIDQAVLIATIAQPRTSTGFIDRFMVSAEAFRIPLVLILNKSDLLSEGEEAVREEITHIYENIGIQVIHTSVPNQENLDVFISCLQGKTSLISGHSGVGKSTLINTIVPWLDLKTSEISDFSNKGTHTTTFAQMFDLGENTYIIDTPGIKELGLIDLEKEEIAHYFPEMRELLGDCRFHNCLHMNEPGCKVKDQVNEGLISESRYYNYLGMLDEHDSYR